MNWNRFKDFYARVGFWPFWLGIALLGLVAYVVFLVFANYVGPYVLGLWLIGTIGW